VKNWIVWFLRWLTACIPSQAKLVRIDLEVSTHFGWGILSRVHIPRGKHLLLFLLLAEWVFFIADLQHDKKQRITQNTQYQDRNNFCLFPQGKKVSWLFTKHWGWKASRLFVRCFPDSKKSFNVTSKWHWHSFVSSKKKLNPYK